MNFPFNKKDYKRIYIKNYLYRKGILVNPYDKFDFYKYLLRINNKKKCKFIYSYVAEI